MVKVQIVFCEWYISRLACTSVKPEITRTTISHVTYTCQKRLSMYVGSDRSEKIYWLNQTVQKCNLVPFPMNGLTYSMYP